MHDFNGVNPDKPIRAHGLDVQVPTNRSIFDFTNEHRNDLPGASNAILPEEVLTQLEEWYQQAATNGTTPIEVFSTISGIPNLTNRIENPPPQTLPGVPTPVNNDVSPPVYDAYYNPQVGTLSNYVVYKGSL